MKTIVLIMLAVLALGCGRAHLYYDARIIAHNVFKERDRGPIARDLDARLGNRAITVDGKDQRTTLGRLPVEVLAAAAMVLDVNERGGEFDLRVKGPRGRLPVTVLVDLEGNFAIQTGAKGYAAVPSGPKAPPGWKPKERAAYKEVMALLGDEERQAVRGVRWSRTLEAGPGRAALYKLNGCDASVTVYGNMAVKSEPAFSGSVRAPKRSTTYTLAHELGHAFESAAARILYCKAKKQPVRRANVLIGRANRLVDKSLILTEYLEVLGSDPAPTDYGRTSPRESFAESFALFIVDPEALVRARPKVHAWFARGGHLQAHRDSL